MPCIVRVVTCMLLSGPVFTKFRLIALSWRGQIATSDDEPREALETSSAGVAASTVCLVGQRRAAAALGTPLGLRRRAHGSASAPCAALPAAAAALLLDMQLPALAFVQRQ